jgi:Zn-dependent protease/predicted transcriptional regulator
MTEPRSGDSLPVRPAVQPTRSAWSWRAGTIAGIPIRIHLTLVFLLAWIALSSIVGGLRPQATLAGILLVVAVFVIIVIHELGHALMARRFGVETREILLLPIGGIASLEQFPERPSHELAIALVGPAINLVLAGVLALEIMVVRGSLDPAATTTVWQLFAVQLMWVNLWLALFNLIPAFPMDGGRVLRALLAMRLGRLRATDVAAALAKVIAAVFAMLGLLFNPWLILIAVVVWLGARQEAGMVRLRAAISDVPVSAAMKRQIEVVTPDQPLEQAARLLVATGQSQLPIVEHGEMVGVLTRGDVASGMAAAGADGRVAAAPHHDAVTVTPAEPLAHVFDRLVSSPDAIAVVVDDGVPVGIVTADQLAMFAALRAPPTPT